ncbi:MAG: response regulator [Campylobacterales bacterium]|nr:response regulator [Campylobacterales bacterium]
MRFTFAIVFALIFVPLWADTNSSKKENYGSVVIGQFNSKIETQEIIERVKSIIDLDADLKKMQETQKLKISLSEVSSKLVLEIKPFYDEQILAFAYLKIHEYYPKSFIVRYGYVQVDELSKAQREEQIAKEMKAAIDAQVAKIKSTAKQQDKFDSNQKLWIALGGLGLFSLLILFWSFFQNRSMRKLQKEMYAKQFKLEEDQSKLLSSVGDKIHDTTKEVMQERDKILDAPITKISKKSFDEKIRDIKKADTMLKDTTNDLIEFLKIKSGKITLQSEPFDINNVLNEVSGLIAHKFKNKNKHLIDFIYELDANVPKSIVGDAGRLSQLLVNLLENAFKFTSRGEVKLSISTAKINNENALAFSISDTGIGIKKDKIDKLFDAFDYDSDANDDANRNSNNSLGLYITKELLRHMGGEISAQSHFGKGSTFTFKMPYQDISTYKGDKVFSAVYKKLHDVIVNKKVMIIDKNSDSSWAIQNMFKLYLNNVLVQSEKTVRDNEDLMGAQDILIIDERLLDRNNILFLENVKNKNNLKVVSLTSMSDINTDEEDEELRGKKANLVDIYLSRPLTPSRVEETIRSIYWKELESVENAAPRSELPIYKEEFEETANIERSNFSVFMKSKVLIGEPNKINQRVLLGILEESGIECEVADNGEDVLHELSKYYNNFNLVIINLNLPIIDGYIVARKIRENSKFRDLPIIGMSGSHIPEEVELMIAAGMNAHLTTPIRIGTLYTAFSKYLEAVDINKLQKELVSKKSKGIFDTVPNILDIQEGVARANDNEDMFAKVLKEFVETYGNSNESFRKLVEQKRYVQAKSLAMDMKGITQAIGAKDMHIMLNEIHQLFMYNKQDQLPKYVERFDEELKKLLLNIDVFQRSF